VVASSGQGSEEKMNQNSFPASDTQSSAAGVKLGKTFKPLARGGKGGEIIAEENLVTRGVKAGKMPSAGKLLEPSETPSSIKTLQEKGDNPTGA